MTLEKLMSIFSSVLGVQVTDPTADFFCLGGDSLLATRVLSRIARESGAELTLADFLEVPTPQGLQAAIGGRST